MPKPRMPDLSPSGWERAIAALADEPGVAMVLGASDSGKTTWVAAAMRAPGRAKSGLLAIVDADIGQSSIGPPATVALALVRERPASEHSLDTLPSHALAFVGSVSPLGHLLQLLAATKRLTEQALQSGANTVLIDTTGLIDQGPGFQLKLRKIELLAPVHLIALQRERELEPLLSVVAERPGLTIHRLAVPPSVRIRTQAERAQYRAARFAAYFAGATTLPLESGRLSILAPPTSGARSGPGRLTPLLSPSELRDERLTGLLVGLHDSAGHTLGLGMLQGLTEDHRQVRVLTPVTDAAAVRILQVGSVRLDRLREDR